jgi:hypothetical protein
MILTHRIPKAPLSNFIRLLWYCEGEPQAHAKERILPTGTAELVINLKEDVTRMYDKRDPQKCLTYKGTTVVGVMTEYAVIDTEEQMCVMGVNFRPGGAFPFFAHPLSELKDLHLSLEDSWGAEAETLRSRLLAIPTIEGKFDLLEAVLYERMRCFEHHRAVQFALQEIKQRHTQPVADLVNKIGMSSRRFIQLFSDQVGLTPKLFCRVQRFQQVIHEIRG